MPVFLNLNDALILESTSESTSLRQHHTVPTHLPTGLQDYHVAEQKACIEITTVETSIHNRPELDFFSGVQASKLQLRRVLTRDVTWLESAQLNLSFLDLAHLVFELIHSAVAVLISKISPIH